MLKSQRGTNQPTADSENVSGDDLPERGGHLGACQALATDAWSSEQWCVSIVTWTSSRYPRSSARYESQLFGLCATIDTIVANFPMPTCHTCKSVTTESPSLSTAQRISSGKSDDAGVRSSRIPPVSRNNV